jgi:hypothetical protein
MHLDVYCPNCRRKYKVPPSHAGAEVLCKPCDRRFRVPGSRPPPADRNRQLVAAAMALVMADGEATLEEMAALEDLAQRLQIDRTSMTDEEISRPSLSAWTGASLEERLDAFRQLAKIATRSEPEKRMLVRFAGQLRIGLEQVQ